MTERFNLTGPDRRAEPGGQPVKAEQVSYTVTWLKFLMTLSLMIAWVVPAVYLLTRVIWPPVDRGPRDADSFMVLAYSGVSAKTNEVSPALFREHITALKRNGYVPVTLQEVRDLLRGGRALPRKAVLLTMDHSRKTSYYLTKSFLRRAGWNAVMFLWTHPIENNDPSALLWPYVRALMRARNWEVGAQSHAGYEKVPADPYEKTGHYLTTRRWIEAEKRYETFDELSRRVQEDHQKCLSIIQKNLGRRPIAYAYPYGDFGQYQRREQNTKRINLAAAGRYYELAFLTGNFPLNTRSSDPRRLNRLKVRPEWSGQDLVDRLERSWPQEARQAFTNVMEAASAWVVDWGAMRVEASRLVLESEDKTGARPAGDGEGDEALEGDNEWLVLQATEKITGARMWMGGSDRRADLYWRIPFRLLNGQMGVFVRGTPDEEQYVYLGVDTAGSVWLRQKHAGLETFTLASTKTRLKHQEDNVLEVYVRGALFGAILNGAPLFSEGLVLRGAPEPGMVGISVWDTQMGRARLEIGDVTISPQEPTLVSWKEEDVLAPFHTRWIHRNGFRITHLSPAWLTVSAGGYLSQLAQDPTVNSQLARIYRLRQMPKVEIKWDRWITALTPGQLVRSVQDIQANGVYVDFSSLDVAPISTLTTWLQQLMEQCAARGLELAVRMPRLLEDPSILQPVIAALPALQLAVSPESPARKGIPGAQKAPMLTEPMPQPADGSEVPFVYQIERSVSVRELSVPERIRLLQEEGKAALLANNFQDAIALWTRWHELDPGDSAPLMLIGDVYVRMGDTEKALDFYKRSLELDPGKISLAMRRVNLLESAGRGEEALKEINLYARLFPENSAVLIAQAEWLNRNNRPGEARDLVRRLLELKPDDIEVLINAIRLSPSRAERRAFINRLAAFRERPELHLEFGEAIERYDLLSLPDAYLLMPIVEEIARTSPDEQIATLFQQFRILREPVVENFAIGRLSDAWRVDGGEAMADSRAMLRVQAGEARREVSARLRGSELVQNGFIELELVGQSGEFWLMARRGPNHFVRFGFDQASMLFLQVFKDGKRFANQRRYFPRMTQSVRLRLVVRGNGALGFINDEPAFEAPITLPRDLGAGAWGFSIYDPEPGRSMARLSSLSAGPLPLVIGVLPPPSERVDQDRLLGILKTLVRDLGVMAPRWFVWQPDGLLERRVAEEDEMVGILSRFHGLKLLPLIDMAGRDTIDLDMLLGLAREYRTDGFTLMMPWMPPEKWVKDAERVAEQEALDFLLVMPGESDDGPAVVRGLGPSASLFIGQGPAPQLYLQYLAPDEDLTSAPALSDEHNTLLMILQRPPEKPEPKPGRRQQVVQPESSSTPETPPPAPEPSAAESPAAEPPAGAAEKAEEPAKESPPEAPPAPAAPVPAPGP